MTDFVKELIKSIGYPGIVILMIIENVFPPIPSEIIMPFAGYISGEGDLSFTGVVIAGTLGSVLGALPLYYLGYKVGEDRIKTWADKYGRWLLLSGKNIDRASSWFSRHGKTTVFFCRLIPGIRSLISIPAGVDKMNLGIFLLLSTLGTGIWAGILAYAGLLLGKNYQQVDKYLGPVSYIIFGGLLIWYIVKVIRFKKIKTKNK